MRTRTLLIGSAVVIVVVGIVIVFRRPDQPAAPEEDPAVLAITDRGGKVLRDEDTPGRPVVTVRLARPQTTDEDLKLLAPFPDLTAVHLVGTGVTDNGLKHLRHLRDLRTLDLRFTPVTDAGLAELRHFPTLETLVLKKTQITNTGLVHLSGVPNLKSLDLADTAVTDAGLKYLKGLTRLESLGLPPACATEAAFHTLHDLGLLHLFPGTVGADNRPAHSPGEVAAVTLAGIPVTTGVLGELRALPGRTRILMARVQMTDDVLRQLADLGWLHRLSQDPGFGLGTLSALEPDGIPLAPFPLPGQDRSLTRDADIRSVDLAAAPVTDAGVAVLARLPALESLNLNRTKVSAKGAVAAAGWPNLRKLSVTGVPLRLADIRALESRADLDVDGAEVERTDTSMRELREAGELRRLVTEFIPLTELDESDTPDLIEKKARVLTLSGPDVTDAGLWELNGFHDFSALEISGTRVTGTGLAALKGHRGLKRLSLEGSPVSDAGLGQLSAFADLESLNLGRTKVTDAGLVELKSLRRLTRLDLAGTSVTGRGLRELQGLDGLRHLNLKPKQITDEVLRVARESGLLHRLSVAAAPRERRATLPSEVTSLNLAETPVTDAGLAELRELTALRTLSVGFTNISDAGVKEITRFPLTGLALHGTDVTDACLDDLASIRTLRKLRIWETRVTEVGKERLQTALPACAIETVRPPEAVEPGERPR